MLFNIAIWIDVLAQLSNWKHFTQCIYLTLLNMYVAFARRGYEKVSSMYIAGKPKLWLLTFITHPDWKMFTKQPLTYNRCARCGTCTNVRVQLALADIALIALLSRYTNHFIDIERPLPSINSMKNDQSWLLICSAHTLKARLSFCCCVWFRYVN